MKHRWGILSILKQRKQVLADNLCVVLRFYPSSTLIYRINSRIRSIELDLYYILALSLCLYLVR